MKFLILSLSIAISLVAEIVCGQEIPVRNALGRPIFVWSQPEKSRQWQPELYLGKEAVEPLSITYQGQYWIVVGDERRRSIVKGWVDLHGELASDPHAQLVIDSKFLTKSLEKTVWERRNGRWFSRRVFSSITEKVYFFSFEHPPPQPRK